MTNEQATALATLRTAALPGGSTDVYSVVENPASDPGDYMVLRKNAGGDQLEQIVGIAPIEVGP